MSDPICPICGSGPIFAGNADEHGLIVDLYHPCACPPPPTDADYPGHRYYSTVGEDWSDFEKDAARLGAELPGYGGPDWCPIHLRQHCDCPQAQEDRAYCEAMDAYYADHPWHDTRAGYPGETAYPADLDLPKIDYDAAIRNPLPLA